MHGIVTGNVVAKSNLDFDDVYILQISDSFGGQKRRDTCTFPDLVSYGAWSDL